MMREGKDRAAQREHLDEAFRHVRQWRRAVDVGAHTGTWSVKMAERFAKVDAFEPAENYHAKFRARMEAQANATLHSVALADRNGRARIGDGRGKPFIAFDDGGPLAVRTLDSFRFEDVDLLKIDVEGADALVLAGARETIARCRPVIIVEHLPRLQERFGLAEDAVPRALQGLGARLVAELPPDLIYVFD